MDEAAAKLRVALYSLPPELKEKKTEIDKLQAEDASSGERDYQRAAECKSERLRLETEFNELRREWEKEHQLNELVDAEDIAELQSLIEEHAERTGSTVAEEVLENWDMTLGQFVKVMPTDYKRVLEERQQREKELVA